ncbi:MAG: class II aldolase/adducin family protein [Dehalococcoidales bacterium]|nr:class II aldolase/adducin family protein [Dehalococcoidales bacterium]
MPESLHYVKFQPVMERGQVQHPLLDELLQWCHTFQLQGLVPDPASGKKGGNLSFRVGSGFITTPSGKPLDQLTREDLVRVTELDEASFRVHAVGRLPPTSEAFLHSYVYRERTETNAIFHGECALITENAHALGIPETERWQDYGTPALAYEVLKVLHKHPGTNCLVMKKHGELYLGKTMLEVGNTALAILAKARGL